LKLTHDDAYFFAKANTGGVTQEMEIVKEPYLGQLRTEVAALKRLLDEEPNEIVVTQAWRSFAKIKDALKQLCPNHRAIWEHR
jgi:hypothetical protein